MMRAVNVWIALRDDAQASIHERVTWDEETQGNYTGPVTDREFKLFSKIATTGVQKFWRVDTDTGRQWTVWSLNFSENLAFVAAEINQLLIDRPNVIRVVGAWWFDGRQVGTQWELDGDGNRTGNTTGTPTYPIHSRILNFMPVGHPAGGVHPDPNRMMGQQPRRFF